MKKRQKEILTKVADRHGLSFNEAKEIWELLCDKVYDTITEHKKTEDRFEIEKFKTIHIQNFGKFVPNKKKINYANHCLKQSKSKKEND